MKKQYLLLTLMIISGASFAQLKPVFGFRAGVTSSGMRGDAINSLNNMLDFTKGKISSGSRTGFFAGGYAAIPLDETFSIEPGLYYTQKGMEFKGAIGFKGAEFLGANAKAKLNEQYIDMPIILKANLNGFQLFAGPQVSYLTSAQLRTTAGIFGINLLSYTTNATNQFNRWDAGVTGGIGYQFTNGINVTAAYDHGLTKIDANRNTNSYNRSVKVGIGVNF